MSAPPTIAPTANAPRANVYRLKSRDGVVVEFSEGALKQSKALRTLIKISGFTPETQNEPFPVDKVDGKILELIAQWCEQHKRDRNSTDIDLVKPLATAIPEWDTNFLNVDNEVLFELIVAANYLEIALLMNYGCKIASRMAKGKNPDELRVIYGIPSDEEDKAAGRHTAEEDAALLAMFEK